MLACDGARDIQLFLRWLRHKWRHLSGVSTTAIEGQQAERLVKYTGIYKVNRDCTISETDTDETGAVFHYDEFTTPKGDSISFVETDPNVVVSGTEHR